MTTSDAPVINAVWLAWLRDFQAVALQTIREATVNPSDAADEELQSIRFALYARALSLLGTACLLAENDKQLDLRIIGRNIVECALHLGSMDSTQDYVAALKADDLASRRSRGKAFKKRNVATDPELLSLLDEFLNQDVGKPKRIEPSALAEDTQFSRLAHAYREISADAAHVSFSSLIRHAVDTGDGVTLCVVDPALSAEELHETLVVIGISVLACTFILARNLPNGDTIIEPFLGLQARFQALQVAA